MVTYSWLRLATQRRFNPFHNLRGQPWHNVYHFQVLGHLFGPDSSQNHGARVWVNLDHPRESELSHIVLKSADPELITGHVDGRLSLFLFTLLGDLGGLPLTFIGMEVFAPSSLNTA